MKIFVFLILLIPSLSTGAQKKCSLYTFNTVLKSDVEAPYNKKRLIKKTNCNQEIQNRFLSTIENLEGVINAKRLQVMISDVLEIHPQKIEIISLENHLRERLGITNKKFIRNLKFTRPRRYIAIDKHHNLTVSCDACEFLGHKNIKLTISSVNSSDNQYLWATFDLHIQSHALKAKSPLRVTNEPVTADDFEKKLVFTQHPERFFLKENALKYYKLNRNLRQGEVLEFNALSPVHLVRPGTLVSIELNENGVKLSGKALPTRAGKLGEIIQLINQKSKRPILGKVVDYNKVVVEL